jgi:hypothetical protein
MLNVRVNLRKVAAIAGCLAVSMVFSGCDKENKPGYGEETTCLLAGKFKSQTGSGDAVFYADYVSASGTKSSATTEKELVGKIEDGDIIFNLRGFFDEATKKFFLSAGSSILVFQILGTLTEGNISNTEATVKVKSGDEWIVHTVAVTDAKSDDVLIDGTVSGNQVAGIPTSWFGTWEYEDGSQVVITSFQYLELEYLDRPAGLLDFETVTSGVKYNVIYEQNRCISSPVEEGQEPEPCEEVIRFMKASVEAAGANLVIKIHGPSGSDEYAVTKEYDMATTNPQFIQTLTLSRP